MLYDNALLTMAYLEGYQATGREDFAQVARETLRYLERDMSSPEGAFYSATDADSLTSEGRRVEGRFFTWTPAEIEAILGKDRARVLVAYYAITKGGNFEGRNILHTPKPLETVANDLKLPLETVRASIQESKEQLYTARSRRPAPLRDEKIVTAWNGLTISAFARAGLVLGDPHYTDRAERAADFTLTKLRKGERLLRSYKGGRAQLDGYLNDYAFFIAGLLDLYEASGNPHWLKEAMALDKVLEEHYEDKQKGGFFLTSNEHEALLAREKPNTDNDEPSGNSVHALNLLRLYEFTTRDQYRSRAEKIFQAFGEIIQRAPTAVADLLLAADYRLDAPKEIVIVTAKTRVDAEPFLKQLRAIFLPNRILVVVPEGKELTALTELVPLVEGKIAQEGKTTAYVCEQKACTLPTTDPAIFAKQIRLPQARQASEDGGATP